MSWQSSVRSLLRDLRCSLNSTPSELQLEQLHVEAYESDGETGWDNLHSVGDIIGDENGRAETFLMDLSLRHAKTTRFCSEYLSSILVGWITALAQQSTDKIQFNRNHKLRIKNDIYTNGVSAELIMSHPSTDTITKAIPFTSVLIRERRRPDSSLTTAELYFALAMAAKHRKLLGTKSINLRLLVIYSHWVQILNVTTTGSYITSIIDGEAAIADKMIIHQTSWFNFHDTSGQLRVLLHTFEGIKLEPKLEPKSAMRTQMPLQEIKPNGPRQQSKRNLDSGEELENKRPKSQKVSCKEASRGSQDVS